MSNNSVGSNDSLKKFVPTKRSKTRYLLDSPYLQPIVPKAPPLHVNSTLKQSSKTMTRTTYSRPVSVNTQRKYDNRQIEKANGGESLQNVERKLSVVSSQCKIQLRFGYIRSSSSPATRHNVCIYQQINRGNPVFVYQGWLHFMDTFTFTSKPHRGFPFSITIYVNSLLVQRVSVCCEYKPRKGYKLGGSKGQFTLLSVNGSFPCYKCLMSESSKTINKTREERAKIAGHSKSSSESEEESGDSQKDYDDDFEEDSDKVSEPESPPRDVANRNHVADSTSHDCRHGDVVDNSASDSDEESGQTATIIPEEPATTNHNYETEETQNYLDKAEHLFVVSTQGANEGSFPEQGQAEDGDSDDNAEGDGDNFTECDSKRGGLSTDDETDDDVVYQAGDSTFNSMGVASSGPDNEYEYGEDPNRWSDYGGRKPFDSSDDEEHSIVGNSGDGRGSAQLTVTADIHSYASETIKKIAHETPDRET